MTNLWNRYQHTTARQLGGPRRKVRPRSTTIDMHAHILVTEAERFVAPHLPADPRTRFYSDETRALGRKQDHDRRANLTDLDLRLNDMDAMGIDIQVISPAPGQCYYTVPDEIGVQAARMVNDGVAAFVAPRPDRLASLGTVPLQAGGEAAAVELERCMRQLGCKGVQILAHVGEQEISDPCFAAFWAQAEALGAVVMIHPAGFTEARRFGRFYFNNVIGNPLDTTMALHHLIFDGVLERHPELKLIAVHGGGYLPSYSGRIDHAWGARSDSHGDLPQPPTTYLRRIYVDSIVFTPHQLEALVKLFSPGHVLMGTDYPYNMGEYDPLEHLAATASLDPVATAMIAGGNAKLLFGL